MRALTIATILIAVSAGMSPSGALADERFGLQVLPEAGESSYDRGLYRHWIDADGDGQNTRQEVLAAESLIEVDSSPVLWVGLYTGFVTTDPGALDIDHMIPLKEVHISGGHAWDTQKREDYANDLGDARTLIAVKGGANRSKGARDPANWMPPNRSYWCTYLDDWVAVKARWELSIDQAEADAIGKGRAVCAKYKSGDHLDGRH